MKWVREAGWLIVLALLAVYFIWLRPPKPAKPEQVQALIDQKRQELQTRQARLDKEVAVIQTDTSLKLLKLVGKAYRRHLAEEKMPPRAEDYPDAPEAWKSNRDGQPFAIQWGVDLTKLSDGGRGMLLAWEQTPAADGSRCVLMADGETAKVVSADEFKDLPRATSPPPG
jgi:hypothetical protein